MSIEKNQSADSLPLSLTTSLPVVPIKIMGQQDIGICFTVETSNTSLFVEDDKSLTLGEY